VKMDLYLGTVEFACVTYYESSNPLAKVVSEVCFQRCTPA